MPVSKIKHRHLDYNRTPLMRAVCHEIFGEALSSNFNDIGLAKNLNDLGKASRERGYSIEDFIPVVVNLSLNLQSSSCINAEGQV